MQPISYGAPIYPNCFDQLTTHGVVAEDVVGYITDKPSPYLQNYVAQRGWAPSMPGQILPDPLPTLQPPNPLPRNDVYQTVATEQPVNKNGVPTGQQINNYVKNEHNNNWKKIAAGVLIAGVTAFGLYKLGGAIKSLFGRTPAPAPAPTGGGTPWYSQIGQSLKNICKSVGDFFKNIWNKITGHTPAPTP